MLGVNKVILVGNLGKDPEVHYFDDGNAIAKFSLATTESYKGKDGQKEEKTEWHNVIVRNALAKVAEKYLRKGSTIYLEGKLRNRTWDDKEGKKHYQTEVNVDNFTMIGPRKTDGGSNGNEYSSHSNDNQESHINDDLPF